MRYARGKRARGQAAVELAVFGFLIVVGFSVLMMYGQQLELQQQVKMEAFRRALKIAHDKNSSVTYSIKKDTRLIDIMGGFGRGQATAVGASGNVMWQKGIPGKWDTRGRDAAFAYYAVNDQMLGDADTGLPRYERTVKGYDGSSQKVQSPMSIWKEEVARQEAYNSTVSKGETRDGVITNFRASNLTDTVTSEIFLRQDNAKPVDAWDVPAPDYDYDSPSFTVRQAATLVMERPTQTITDPASGESYQTYQGMALGDTDPNRVAYNTTAAEGDGTTIHRERQWVTDNLQ